ncbi:zinc-binding dehydrogenase [Gryllotalpicola protaetiae]|uniref:NADPH:quinone reductase n=1 Tax=Gryllotalpicola protaetiae TaxID=2419771 RepID=A0A387BJL6_9MICO|nr:zinc-binding dehydrogenase [Gryllotalpicola protaetiae]AYG02442.1 NADPH:quinone reductase [Gryllotalpicola protaetiae]
MRAVTVEEFGDPSGMAVVDRAVPEIGAGQMLIDVEAIGVGGVDAVIRRGTLGGYGFRPGLVLGSEVAGRVTAVGPGADSSWVGRRVWAFTGVGGGYVEQAVADAGDVVALPERLASVDAVTIGSAAPVAHFALAHGRFRRGESVLIRGAAGSIGIAAVQLAARAGARSIAVTTASAERGRRLVELGATAVLDRTGQGDAADLGEYDVIVDVVGGPGIPSFIDRLAPGGRMVVVGAVAGQPPADFGMHLMRAFQKSLSFATFSLATVPPDERDAVRAAQFASTARGELAAVVDAVLPLDRAADAHRRMDDGSVFGRIVLVP